MERIGIIDLGSNTIRLVIIDIKENGAHHQIESLKESVRLRSGTDAQGYLTAEGIESAVEMVSLFVKFCRARQVKEVIAVATAAVRRAPNRAELIDRIAELTGVTIQVLSSEEEAYLGYLGLINSVTESDGLMADLGGGALKIVGFKDRLNQNSITLDFGAVSLMEAYRLQDLPAGEDLRSMERFLTKPLPGSLASQLPEADRPRRDLSLFGKGLSQSCTLCARCHRRDHHRQRL